MIGKIAKFAWISPLVLGLGCSAGTADNSSNHDPSGEFATRSNELKSNELAPAVATTALSPIGKAIANNPAGQISLGGTSGVAGAPGLGGTIGVGGATGAYGGANANGGTGSNGGSGYGGSSSSCCDKCDGECSPRNWVCIETTCTCECVGGDEPVIKTQGL